MPDDGLGGRERIAWLNAPSSKAKTFTLSASRISRARITSSSAAACFQVSAQRRSIARLSF
jgi:hypothetical protein